MLAKLDISTFMKLSGQGLEFERPEKLDAVTRGSLGLASCYQDLSNCLPSVACSQVGTADI